MALPEPILYYIKPTPLIPNSPKPLLLYKGVFFNNGKVDITSAYDTFRSHGWDVQWVTRYGRHQKSHYHSASHEVMVIVSGPGKIRWGAADLSDDGQEHTYGSAFEDGSLELEVNVGDVFVIPAGIAHKSFDPRAAEAEFGCLTGSARGVESEDPRKAVGELPLTGFMMMGAYPQGFTWDWGEGGDHVGRFETVWSTSNPDMDPVLGDKGGVGKYWKTQH